LQGFLAYPLASSNLAEYMQAISRDLEDVTMSHSGLSNILVAFGCITSAVQYLHVEKSVKHKDIKPENILIDRHGYVLLADFGISKQYQSETDSTTGGPTQYTRKYAAPEVVALQKRGFEADIFSLGCVFLEMVSLVCGKSLKELQESIFGTIKTGAVEYYSSLPNVERWINQLKLSIQREQRRLRRVSLSGDNRADGCTSSTCTLCSSLKPQLKHLEIIERMMSSNPSERPSIAQLYEDFKAFSEDCIECKDQVRFRHAILRMCVDTHAVNIAEELCPIWAWSNITDYSSTLSGISKIHVYTVQANNGLNSFNGLDY